MVDRYAESKSKVESGGGPPHSKTLARVGLDPLAGSQVVDFPHLSGGKGYATANEHESTRMGIEMGCAA